ncbi:MAG: DUF438 domain-containing protein [Anaerolineaceae bacterium]|nr:DUF438 domain-containing protein [Anaerolineaceae bacterium]
MSEFIDNASKRKQMLKDVLDGLHQGKSIEDVKAAFTELVKIASYDDIADAEQMLIEEGLPASEIQNLCDLHVEVVREVLDQQPDPESQAGHPIFTMRSENETAATMLSQIDAMLNVPGSEVYELVKDRLMQITEFERHYLRKENLLFPYLEKYGFTGPSQVMWGIHDDIRKDWKRLKALFSQAPSEDWTANLKAVREIFDPMNHNMTEMFYKEEKILFPVALERLTETDWVELFQQEDELGYFVVKPGLDWQPDLSLLSTRQPSTTAPQTATATIDPAADKMISLATGALTPEQINLMLTNLPFDITFVDENDEVRYFTQGKERIFPRQAAIIGRKVHNCHPPQSVDKVEAILRDFKNGSLDKAEFWIQMAGMFIHIRYFALRDAAGKYRGTIEVSQEISGIRALEGEKRLLDD